MSEQVTPVFINAVAKMPSARLALADLEFIASTVSQLQEITMTWSSREIRTVTATNFSAQSPSVKVTRTFKAKSISEFALRAPRGKIYIMEACFESPSGTAILKLGKEQDLSRNLIISFQGSDGNDAPPWFYDIVRKIVAAKLLNAGQREFYLLCLTWAPVILPAIAVPWVVASGDFPKFGGLPILLLLAGFAWLAYAIFASTIARFVRASSLRVTPRYLGATPPQAGATIHLPTREPTRFRDILAEMNASLKSGWLAFRQSDHQFNGVLIAIVALIVAVTTLVVEVAK